MRYLPKSPADREEMLAEIGVGSEDSSSIVRSGTSVLHRPTTPVLKTDEPE